MYVLEGFDRMVRISFGHVTKLIVNLIHRATCEGGPTIVLAANSLDIYPLQPLTNRVWEGVSE